MDPCEGEEKVKLTCKIGVRNRCLGGGGEEVSSGGGREKGEDGADEAHRAHLSLGAAEVYYKSSGISLGSGDLEIQGTEIPGEGDIAPGGGPGGAPGGQVLGGA